MKRQLAVSSLMAALAISGCAKWHTSTSLLAPDRKTVAQVEVSLAGAPADNRTRIVIKNGAGGDLPQPVIVVEASDAIVGHTKLYWLDANHLKVTLCEATGYRVLAENLRDPAYLDSGRGDGTGKPNAVWVEVENFVYSEPMKRCVPRGTLT